MKIPVEERVGSALSVLAHRTVSGQEPRTVHGILLLAVSGGADSMCMLSLVDSIAPVYGFQVQVVTVDHRLRSEEESGGDTEFVNTVCVNRDIPIPCTIVRLEHGEVVRFASERKKGIEEAARFLRYRVFVQEAKKLERDHGVGCTICTAHTADDQYETLLMRFLQGSGGSARCGISEHAGSLFRPLLTVTRAEIEAWLVSHSLSWRNDSSNESDVYLRNSIRHQLVPVLDFHFDGWRRALDSGSRYAKRDESFFDSQELPSWHMQSNLVSCDADLFIHLHPALRYRFIKKALVLLGVNRRVSAGFLSRIADHRYDETSGMCRISASGLTFWCDGKHVNLSPDIVQNRKSGYLVEVRAPSLISLPGGTLRITETDTGVRIEGCSGHFRFPLIIRSRQSADLLSCVNGKRKTLKKLLQEWAVPENLRDVIPVVEQEGEIYAVCGTMFGFPDLVIQR